MAWNNKMMTSARTSPTIKDSGSSGAKGTEVKYA